MDLDIIQKAARARSSRASSVDSNSTLEMDLSERLKRRHLGGGGNPNNAVNSTTTTTTTTPDHSEATFDETEHSSN